MMRWLATWKCRAVRAALWVAPPLLSVGCAGDSGWDGQLDQPDFSMFEAEVYPVLLRDCAFDACHGARHRYLYVMGPGRPRWSPELEADDPADPREVQLSYERARSMLTTADPVTQSLLLLKPLSIESGGASHKGTDNLGRDVYQSVEDNGYQVLLRWALGGSFSPAVEPGP